MGCCKLIRDIVDNIILNTVNDLCADSFTYNIFVGGANYFITSFCKQSLVYTPFISQNGKPVIKYLSESKFKELKIKQ
jgi:hypothetical protein